MGITCESTEYRDRSSKDAKRRLFADEDISVRGLQSFGWWHGKHANNNIPWHFHRNRFEFHYMIQGSRAFLVNNQRYALKGGEVFVSFPNETHRSDTPNMIRNMYWFSLEDIDCVLHLDSKASDYLMQSLHRLRNRVIPVGAEMRRFMDEIFQNLALPQKGARFYVGMQMASFLYQLIEYDTLAAEQNVSPEIARALDFIEQNKTRSIALEEAAQHCALSLSRFKYRFKNEVGDTPALYIQQKRIECAKTLLQSGHSITQTAYELGFCSSNYFSVVFRRITLMTPSQYIKQFCHFSPAEKR